MATGQIVTNSGKKIALNRLFKSSPDYTVPSKFKVGVGTATPSAADTDLSHAIPITGTEQVDDCDATTGWTDSADMTVSLNTTTFKQGTGSLNLTKDGTGSATASSDKTTTSRDFTSKELSIWVYVRDSTVLAQLATTDCLTLRFGSDSSNYYQWTKDASFFAVGWNLVDVLTTANADSTTGSPSLTVMDYTYVAITATGAAQTWTAGGIIMDDIKLVSSDDYLGSLSSGYPSLDETALEATMRMVLATTDANGYSLTEFGMFNTDASRLAFSRAVFTAITKTSSVQVIIVEKDKIV